MRSVTLHSMNRGAGPAIARAEEIFRQAHPDQSFTERLAHYLKHGFVINFPDLFVMWRPVAAHASLEEMADPRIEFARPNAWYVDLAVGCEPHGHSLRRLLKHVPYHLPLICFDRKFQNRLRIYDLNQLLRRSLA